jgi:homocysteine S-methyltransferase
MPTRSLTERLEAGEALLMDGATGEELRARGADVFAGNDFGEADHAAVLERMAVESVAYLQESDPDSMREVHDAFLRRLGPWSAPLNVEEPEMVRAVHEDYLRVGADIVISNNFFTGRSNLARLGLGDAWETYARAAARLAIDARDAVNAEAYVAGGMAPPPEGDLSVEFAEEAALLADAGVDVILAEYLGTVEEAVAAVEACAPVGLPVLLGMRHVSATGTLQYLQTFEELARALDGAPVAGVLLMCSPPEHVSVGLPKLRDAYGGVIGAYSHNPVGLAEGQDEYARFAEYGEAWLKMGAQIVGGCCRTRPRHIAALAPVVAMR